MKDMNKTYYVKYIGIIDGDMGILTRKVNQLILGYEKPLFNTQTRNKSAFKITPESTLLHTLRCKANLRRKASSQVAFYKKKMKEAKVGMEEIVFKLNKPTLPNIFTSPIKKDFNIKPEMTTVQTPHLFFTIDPKMERAKGIPNPDKYNINTINNLMPSKKFLVTHNLNEPKRIKNYQSLFKLHCPHQRTGVSGTKISKSPIRNRMPKLHKEICGSLSPFKTQIQERRLRNWEVYQKTVLLKSNKNMEDNSFTMSKSPEQVLQIKSSCWPFKDKQLTRKRKLILKLNCTDHVFISIRIE